MARQQQPLKPTRKLLVQALTSMIVTAIAGLLARSYGLELAGEVLGALEVLVAAAIGALVPAVVAWITPPSSRDGVTSSYH